jgi:hypothetical protein
MSFLIHRNVKRGLLALSLTLLILPAAVSEGHERAPHDAGVAQHAR